MHFMAFFAGNYYVIAHNILKAMFSQYVNISAMLC